MSHGAREDIWGLLSLVALFEGIAQPSPCPPYFHACRALYPLTQRDHCLLGTTVERAARQDTSRARVSVTALSVDGA